MYVRRTTLKTEIIKLVATKCDLEIELTNKQEEHNRIVLLLDQYRLKIADYEKLVTEEAKSSHLFQAVIQCRENINKLQEQSKRTFI